MRKCKDVMTPHPSACLITDTAVRAARIMLSEDVGPVPIVSDEHTMKPVGIVTDRDLALQVVAEGRDPHDVQLGDVMTRQLLTCRLDDDLDRALDLMQSHQVRRILVVDEDDRLAGIIAQADVAVRTGDRERTADLVSEVSRGAEMR